MPTAQQEPAAIDLTLSDDEEDAAAAPAQPAVAGQAAHAAQPAVAASTSPLAPAPWGAQSIPPPSPAVGSPELLTPQAHAAALAAAAQAEEEAADAQSRQSQQQRVASALGDFADRLMRKLVGKLSHGPLICSGLHASAACMGLLSLCCADWTGAEPLSDALLSMPEGPVTCVRCKTWPARTSDATDNVKPSPALSCSRWGQAQRQSALPSATLWLRSRSRLLLRTGSRWLRCWAECSGPQAAVLLMDKTKLVRSDSAHPCRVLGSMESVLRACALAFMGSIADCGRPTGCQGQAEIISEHEQEMPRPVLQAQQAGWQDAVASPAIPCTLGKTSFQSCDTGCTLQCEAHQCP